MSCPHWADYISSSLCPECRRIFDAGPAFRLAARRLRNTYSTRRWLRRLTQSLLPGDLAGLETRTPQSLRMLLGAFRGGNPLERIVGVPSLWPRPGGVLQQHGLGVTRPSLTLSPLSSTF